MITVDDFIRLFNGHWCDWDGVAGNQCFDMANYYSWAIGGQPFYGTGAKDIYTQAGTFYTQIPNTPTAVPQKGDIVVWSGALNGGWGHVGVSTGVGDINTFQVLEQNDPTNKSCQLKTYNYGYVLGWLHPKVLPTDAGAKYEQLVAYVRQAKDILSKTGV